MYVIFPLDQLLDNNSAYTKSKAITPNQSGNSNRHTVEVLSPIPPITQPNSQQTVAEKLPPKPKTLSLKKSSSKTSLASPSTPLSSNPFIESPVNCRQILVSSINTNKFDTIPVKRQSSLKLSSQSSGAESSSTSSGSKTHVARRSSFSAHLGRSPSINYTSSCAIPVTQSFRQSIKEPSKEVPTLINTEVKITDVVLKPNQTKSDLPSPSDSIIPTESVLLRETDIPKSTKNIVIKSDSIKGIESQTIGDSFRNKDQETVVKDSVVAQEFPVAIRGSIPPDPTGSRSSSARSRESSSLGRKGSANKSGGVFPGVKSPFLGIMANDVSHKNLIHPSLNEQIKTQNSVNFKLVKTVSDFTAQLSRLHERHSDDLQNLVHTFRRKNSELRNERAACPLRAFDAWESLLQEVEVDSQVHSDVAITMGRQVSRPLIEKSFYRKIQSRKVFTHRESFEAILAKTEDTLKKCWRDYSDAYHEHFRDQNSDSLTKYMEAHNTYVQQLHATNAMLYEYHNTSLPSLLEELDEVYLNVSSILAESLQRGSELLHTKAVEKQRRCETLRASCHSMDPGCDLSALVRALENPSLTQRPYLHRFVAPQAPPATEAPSGEMIPQNTSHIPHFRNEMLSDPSISHGSKGRFESLMKESSDLQRQIAQLQESQDAMAKIQTRSLDSLFYNKANEIQEDISMRKFDLRVAQMHLAAVKAQKDLLASREGGGSDGKDRKMSATSNSGGMKSKWIKAFKSLKTPSSSGQTSKDNDKKNGRDPNDRRSSSQMMEGMHVFQEYTYKKITACDICHQILRGHSRQGLKCRMCRLNVHSECQDKTPKCQPKSGLLRRQRSTSEIETKIIEPLDEDYAESSSGFISLIASQPGRRMVEHVSPPGSATSGHAPPSHAHPTSSGRAIKSL